jgi:hypothetical protein
MNRHRLLIRSIAVLLLSVAASVTRHRAASAATTGSGAGIECTLCVYAPAGLTCNNANDLDYICSHFCGTCWGPKSCYLTGCVTQGDVMVTCEHNC